MMFFNHAPADCQTEAGTFAFRLRRKERVPNFFEQILWNAGPLIDYRYTDAVDSGRVFSDANAGNYFATFSHRIARIIQKIQKHLTQLLAVGLDGSHLGRIIANNPNI